MPLLTDQGIILHRQKCAEADLILTILSKHSGKKKYIAKGVRKINSKRGGHLGLFNIVEFQTYSGKTWDSITEVKTLYTNFSQQQSDGNLKYYYLVSEILDRLLADEELSSAIYDLSVSYFQQIVRVSSKNKHTLKFIIKLLVCLGFGTTEVGDPRSLNNIDRLSLIIEYIETIIERPVKSRKLFRN